MILDRLTVEHDAKNWHRKLADRHGVMIVITSYDYSSKLMKRFPDVKWDFLIIDEAHNLLRSFRWDTEDPSDSNAAAELTHGSVRADFLHRSEDLRI